MGVRAPLTADGEKAVRDFAAKALKDYPATEKAAASSDPTVWAGEGLNLAKSTVYGLEEGSAPSPAYLATCRRVSGERIVLAGKRLAALLNRVLG